jgi:hypothetical protein
MSGKLLAKHFSARHREMGLQKNPSQLKDVHAILRRKAASKLKQFRKTHGSKSRIVMRNHLKTSFGKPMHAPLPKHLRAP